MYQLLSALVIAALVGADQLFKYLAESSLAGAKTVTVIPGVIRFELVHNEAGMFGMFGGMRNVLSALTIVIIAVALVFLMMRKIKPFFVSCCATAIIAGGIGNLIDRLFRGYVIDYIGTVFCNFPVYNFADCLVTVGCFALIGYEIYVMVVEAKAKKKNSSGAENG